MDPKPTEKPPSKEPEKPQANEPPDGGTTAWIHVLLTHIVFFNTWGVANGYGVFQQYYTQTLGQSQMAISWIGSIQVFFLFSVGVVAGRMTDAGYFRPVFALGVFLQVFGLFMTSLCGTSYPRILLAQAVCLGIGNGCTFCPALAILSQYFKKYRAIAVGIAAAGAAVGGLAYPVIINWLIFKDHLGFPWTVRIMAFVMLATYIPCLLLYKPRLAARRSGPWVDWEAFSDPAFVMFTASMAFSFWGLYLTFFYLGTFARDKIGFAEPIYLLMVLNAVGIFGRIVPTIAADRYVGSLNMLVPTCFGASLLVYCWAAINNVGGLFAFAVIYGIFAASAQALFPGVATTMTPDPSRTGTRMGMILSIVSLANLTGPAICGALIKQQGGEYLGAQMFGATSILIGAFFALGTRIAKTGMVFWVKV